MNDAVIIDAVRTPIGKGRPDGALAGVHPVDLLAEPHRAALVPGFRAVQTAALDAGALGCSLSGAGPSVFAWCADETVAGEVRAAMCEGFDRTGVETAAWISPVNAPGAHLVETEE